MLDNFYSYARGDRIMVALTNGGEGAVNVVVKVPNSPFAAGEKICNIFWPTQDCILVGLDKSATITLVGGEAKVFVR